MRWELVQRGVVGALVVALTLLDPVWVLAQRNGGVITPPAMQPPHLRVPDSVSEVTGDPVLDDVVRNLQEVQRDIRARGLKAEHLRTHAAGLRVAAKHIKSTGLNEKIMTWAKAQDPAVFQFQAFDPADVARVRTRLEQQGFSTEVIGAVLNSSPDFKVRALTLLQTKGPSGVMLDLAAALDENAAARVDSRDDAVRRNVRVDCGQLSDLSGFFGAFSLGTSLMGPEAWPVSFAFAFDSTLLWAYSWYNCPGLAWLFRGYQPPVSRERRHLWNL